MLEKHTGFSVFKILSYPALWKASVFCVKEIIANFFILQFKARLFPQKIKVTNVECTLDEKIPFRPEFVKTYLDFAPLWIRMLGFLLKEAGTSAIPYVKDFILSIANIYKNAAEIYKKNMSTTNRPHYRKRLRFIIIHALDPHLLCVPSLHIMVLVNTYIKFNSYVKHLSFAAKEAKGTKEAKGDNGKIEKVMEDIFVKAVKITESVLYIKQHSINCIAAALYVMTIFEPELFPQAQAAFFVNALFNNPKIISSVDAAELRVHILKLYKTFLDKSSVGWETPIFNFLEIMSSE